MIRYSCHSENFGPMSLKDTFAFISALQYDCIDVSSRALIPQNEIQADPLGKAGMLKELSSRYRLPLSELFLSDVEIDGEHISPCNEKALSKDFQRNFETICRFAREAGFLSIMGSAGAIDPDLGYQKSFDRIADVLNMQVSVAADYGIAFHVEPYRLSILHTPEACLAMAETVPDLKYTLDFLHFQIQGIPQSESMKLLPCAGHLHVRQARTNTGKCDIRNGQIDYESIVQEMKRINWSGDIATEFWCSQELADQGVQAVEQNLVMRYYLKMLFSA